MTEQPAFKREDYQRGMDTRTLTPYAIPVLDLDSQRYYDDFPLLYASDQQKLEDLIGDGFIFASNAAIIGYIYFYILDLDGNQLESVVFPYGTTDIVGNMNKLHAWLTGLDKNTLRAKRSEAGTLNV